MSLSVYWGKVEVGRLERVAEHSRDYTFSYTNATRPISLSLPLERKSFDAQASRPFFEGLLPEDTVRDRLARQLKLAPGDSYGLLAAIGRDCAGALQVLESKRLSETPSVDWLSESALDELIRELPRHPLGIQAGEERMRLSLAGVQQKAVLVRDESGRFGRSLGGMPSSHILKPERTDGEYPGLAVNECFCMRLAERCGLPTAKVELSTIAERACLVVQRFDRDPTKIPIGRVHQEDLCQALGLTPYFKYQREDALRPSLAALAELLDEHSAAPGVDRLTGALAAMFNFIVGNADAHAKNISLLYTQEGIRLAPLYDVVSTEIYPELDRKLALAIGDELNPDAITSIHWSDLADDFSLNRRAFAGARRRLAERTATEARALADQARIEGWHEKSIDAILAVIEARVVRAVG
ncbi:MAG TPA: type II toxin-antitoxin system HipA family toxin [Solirubrobacteraceae bacterium]|nr:type II toxin-antitoxin system HipA family toxin [Solirubrobacteraceae bacterium]